MRARYTSRVRAVLPLAFVAGVALHSCKLVPATPDDPLALAGNCDDAHYARLRRFVQRLAPMSPPVLRLFVKQDGCQAKHAALVKSSGAPHTDAFALCFSERLPPRPVTTSTST